HYKFFDPPRLIAAGIALIAGAAALLRGIARLQDAEPGLSVGPRGIRLLHEYSNARLGPIPWSAVRRIEPRRYKGRRYIALHVDAEDRYLPPTGLFGGLLRRHSARITGSAIFVSPQWLQISPDDLQALLQRYFEHYAEARRI